MAWIGALALVGGALGLIGLALAIRRGFRASDEPTKLEATLARAMRAWSVPSARRERRSPLRPDAATLKRGLAHWADHCAICHANEGSGKTAIGLHLYPRAPDMRASATQGLTDGELFEIIQHGIRLTGMPAWGGADDDEETWALVAFIRHLSALTPDELQEMDRLNPRGPEEAEEDEAEDEFLRGGEPPVQGGPHHEHHAPRSGK